MSLYYWTTTAHIAHEFLAKCRRRKRRAALIPRAGDGADGVIMLAILSDHPLDAYHVTRGEIILELKMRSNTYLHRYQVPDPDGAFRLWHVPVSVLLSQAQAVRMI